MNGHAIEAEWAEGPRERLLRLGAAALTDAELVAVVLGTRRGGRPAKEVADALVASGGLKHLFSLDPHELAALPGLGPHRAAQVLAALELGRRALKATDGRPRLLTPGEIYRHVCPTLALQRREMFVVLCLNARNVLLREAVVSVGSASACPVDPREVFAPAIASRANGIAIAHNHPSGDPEPSASDLSLTSQLAEGCRLLGVRLLDHLVVGDGRFVSMRLRGLLWSADAPALTSPPLR